MHGTTSTALLLALLGTASSAPAAVEPRQDSFGGTTQNGLQGGACKPMMVIFARGTTEGGNVGSLAGPPFFQALAKQVGPDNLAVQGVKYPANIPGFLAGGDANGSQLMAKLTTQAVSSCPNSAVIMSGYSQGGQLVHNAAGMLSPDVSSKVAGAVIFGDPMDGKPVKGVPAAKTKVICHQGDNICEGGDQIKRQHLTYNTNADEAASFAASMMKGVNKSVAGAAAPPAAAGGGGGKGKGRNKAKGEGKGKKN